MYLGVIAAVINSYFPGNVNGLYEFYFNKKSSNENRPINTFKLVTINMIIFIGAFETFKNQRKQSKNNSFNVLWAKVCILLFIAATVISSIVYRSDQGGGAKRPWWSDHNFLRLYNKNTMNFEKDSS